MKALNMTSQTIPGTERGFDGKMDYYFKWPYDYRKLDSWHIGWLHWIVLNSGFINIVPNFEGARTEAPDGVETWLRYNLKFARLNVQQYLDCATIFEGATNNFQKHMQLPFNYIEWGIFGFPGNSRAVADGRRTLDDYLEQVRIELPVTQKFKAFYPSVYVREFKDLLDAEAQLTALREALDVANPDGRPVYPYFQWKFASGDPLPRWGFRTYMEMIRDIVKPDGIALWDGQSAWGKAPLSNLEVVNEMARAFGSGK